MRKILSVSGQPGLFTFVASTRNGVIAESLESKKRMVFGASSRISSLADISVYKEDGEIRLSDLFLALKDAIGDGEVPSSKDNEAQIVELFSKAVPDYDESRFHVSHMRKILLWYSQLVKYASLDFVNEDEGGAGDTEEEQA